MLVFTFFNHDKICSITFNDNHLLSGSIQVYAVLVVAAGGFLISTKKSFRSSIKSSMWTCDSTTWKVVCFHWFHPSRAGSFFYYHWIELSWPYYRRYQYRPYRWCFCLTSLVFSRNQFDKKDFINEINNSAGTMSTLHAKICFPSTIHHIFQRSLRCHICHIQEKKKNSIEKCSSSFESSELLLRQWTQSAFPTFRGKKNTHRKFAQNGDTFTRFVLSPCNFQFVSQTDSSKLQNSMRSSNKKTIRGNTSGVCLKLSFNRIRVAFFH